ncbi:MAG: low molecular weight phosphotyrosine protein phosphatase [Calditrichaeota bacterium]|nr:MAG: low molecular weight phosphotyrosine protein phosphatase [Calditrichota bacterium]
MISVLFVCLGNICRSPSGEAVFRALVEQQGLSDHFRIDSAGIIGWHAGEGADARMKRHAARRGYDLTSISRQVTAEDLRDFDYIIAMDDQNLRDLKRLDTTGEYGDKFYKMTDFCRSCTETVVPDPYYGGAEGFEKVLDLLEDACAGLLDHIRNRHDLPLST